MNDLTSAAPPPLPVGSSGDPHSPQVTQGLPSPTQYEPVSADREPEAHRVLLVSAEPWARNVLSMVSSCSQRRLEVTHAINGAQGLYYMSQSIHLGQPYQLLVLTTPLNQLGPEGCIEALRAIERGLNRPPYPCLLCTPQSTPPALIARHPQTLHLQVPNSPQAASMVAAGVLQVIHTLQMYQQSADASKLIANQLEVSTLDISLGGAS